LKIGGFEDLKMLIEENLENLLRVITLERLILRHSINGFDKIKSPLDKFRYLNFITFIFKNKKRE